MRVLRYLRTLLKLRCTHYDPDLKGAEEAILQQLLMLRRLNRFAMYRNRHERNVASEMLSVVDSKFLQLQNANNEIEHIRKEIERCYEFKSTDGNIDLVPLEEFYEKAPAAITREEVTRIDLHEQRIARLNWEMLERQNLVATLQELEGRKNVLLSDISKKEYRLKSLKPKIEAIIDATRPVQELMSLKVPTSIFDNQRLLFGYLPKELSVVAIQTEAYCDIVEDRDVTIECQGDIEAAVKFLEGSHKELSENDDDLDQSCSVKWLNYNLLQSGGYVSPIPPVKRHHNTASEQIIKKRNLVLVEHPMSLVLTIRCDKCYKLFLQFLTWQSINATSMLDLGDITVSLHLRYIPEVQAIAAKAKLIGTTLLFYGSLLCDESLLIDLFPKDDGEKCSNPVGQVKLQQLRINVSDYESRIGRFFQFAQKMAGIDQGDSNTTNLCDIIQSVISEIQYRVRTRSALIRCIKNLSAIFIIVKVMMIKKPCYIKLVRLLKVFEEMPLDLRNQFPARIVSRLSEFRMLTLTQFLAHEAVTDDYKKLVTAEASSCLENHFFFTATIERSDAILTVLIFVRFFVICAFFYVLKISTLYPKYSAPIYDLEAELNLMSRSYFKCAEEYMLYGQITFLMSRFDCFLEMYAERIQSKAFSREHLYTRRSRGRDLQMPLAFDASTTAFTFS
uniref:THO complex subunit 5 n=1 Tax=Syphacia muris TaxID=451379 RepID=A0A158R473_9BILA